VDERCGYLRSFSVSIWQLSYLQIIFLIRTIGKIHQSGKKRFVKHYNIDKDTAVDYNVFLKNLSVNNDLNLRYSVGNQEISWNNQPVKNSKGECLHRSVSSEDVWKNCSLDEIERTFCQEFSVVYIYTNHTFSYGWTLRLLPALC